jgi:SAGA-associated factor 73
MTCCLRHIKRRIKQNNKVRMLEYPVSIYELTTITEAAIDANAPLEDEDEANAGPVDSDEETAAVMNSLSRWNPRPIVEQPVLMPIKRQYQLARLREQLDNATSGGTVNIFKVVSKNGDPLKETNGNAIGLGIDGEDAPGEPDYGIVGVGGSRRASSVSFGLQQPPQRRTSGVAVRA